jgi:hypothetical protein
VNARSVPCSRNTLNSSEVKDFAHSSFDFSILLVSGDEEDSDIMFKLILLLGCCDGVEPQVQMHAQIKIKKKVACRISRKFTQNNNNQPQILFN